MTAIAESSIADARSELGASLTSLTEDVAGLRQLPLSAARLFATVNQALRNHYTDVTPIGAGRSGYVFCARPIVAADAPEREESVAIKVAYPGTNESSGTYQRFLREAKLGASLRHPNVVSVSPMRTSQGVTWFEMPFLSGLRLDRIMRNERTITVAHAVSILRDIASALDHAASQGVAHGALRPSEIVIRPNGHAMLSGFLLDRSIDIAVPASLAPSALGDPAYMAPEQWADGPVVGPLADQYALAILAAELLGGAPRVMHNRSGMAEVMPLSIGHTRPLRPGLGLHVNEALLRATSRDQWLRFRSCTAFVHALGDPALTDHHALETHMAPRVRPRLHHWLRFGLVLAAFLTALVMFVVR